MLSSVRFRIAILLLAPMLLQGSNIYANPQSVSTPQKMGPVGESDAKPESAEPPVASVIDPGVIPSRQGITPAGLQSVFDSRVFGVAFDGNGSSVYAATLGRKGGYVYQIDVHTNRMLRAISSPAVPGMRGLALDRETGGIWINGLSGGGKHDPTSGLLVPLASPGNAILERAGSHQAGGLSIAKKPNSAHQQIAVAALTSDDEAEVVDVGKNKVLYQVHTGVAPFATLVNADGSTAFVSNWGGRAPRPGERAAAAGPEVNADQVLVDARGIASNGTVTRIDLQTGKATATIAVGLHPSGLACDEQRHLLYVANSNSDTVSVVSTVTNSVLRTIPLHPFSRSVAGVAPEALALSPDNKTLYAACAGINAIAVIDVSRSSGPLLGLIPTGWYPVDIAVSPDGGTLAVGTLLGVGSGWNSPNLLSREKRDGMAPELNIHRRYVHADRGTLHIIPVPDADELGQDSIAVAEDNHMRLGQSVVVARANPHAAPTPVPAHSGEPSPITHILYIIKENRSYDQYFGSLGIGDGDPSLNLYADDAIPNQRKLAREFVLLDHFFANGGNSADGHQWLTQAAETDYTYWPGYGGRSYPKNGDDPLAFANSGFLWDHLPEHSRTFADFGEFVGEMGGKNAKFRADLLAQYRGGSEFIDTFHTKAPIARLNQYLVPDYPSYGLKVPDVVRARIFLRHLKMWETSKNMPNLVMLQLPSDHTEGTTPGFSTPRACLADNDLAIGQIVEGVSHSRFWKSTLILIVEDDAQDGLDHVDGHRTVALAISPYIHRHSIDSTFYSQVSMVKTIELILGLPPLSLFDRIATDMRRSFSPTPDFHPYTALVPAQSIYEMNPEADALSGQAKADALASRSMNWVQPDDVPTQTLNAILWRNATVKPYPGKGQAATLQSH